MSAANKEIPNSLKTWVDFAKQQKAYAVEKTERGDIHPSVIVERDGKVLAIVIAPQIDKHLGLQAAAMCQAGFDPDSLTVVFDAHIHSLDKVEGQTIDQAAEEFRKKFPPGSMQKMCDEEGACETGLITDCLICHRIARDGKISMVTLPYSYHGKNGPPFEWLDDKEKTFGGDEGDGFELRGMIPDSLRKIMSAPPVLDQVPYLKEQSEKSDFSPERTRFHTARAIMSLMSSHKFVVIDLVSGTHPEWTNAKEMALSMIDKMGKEGFFPKEAIDPITKIADKVGTPSFRLEMLDLLTKNSYWLPAQFRDEIPQFISEFESICLSPSFPEDEGTDAEAGNRVRVWNGDRSVYLGEGEVVGNVTVYAIQMPDGSLRSCENAEKEPNEVPEGGKVISAKNNPKIVLDSGDTVYGCQVWWESIETHQHGPNCNHN